MKTIKLMLLSIMILALSCSKDDEDTVTEVPSNVTPDIKAQSFNASETISDTDVFGMVKATDADKDELSYSITTNSDNLFEITKTGALSLVSGKTLDFETKTMYEITVEVTDGKAKATAKITIKVINADENMPPVIADQVFTVSENIKVIDIIGTIVATDPDGDTLTYTLTNPDNPTTAFVIVDDEIKLSQGEKLDYETETSHVVTVTVDDGTLTASAQITINVTDGNDAPVISAQTFTVAEDISDSTIIGTISASDPNGDFVDFTIITNSNNLFDINPGGEITLKLGNNLDYETSQTHTITVEAYDTNVTPSLTTRADFTINVTNIIEVTVSTFAGNFSGYADGTGMNARFLNPVGTAIDSHGNIFVAEYGNHRIRKITPAGVVTTFAGSSTVGAANGIGTNAQFNAPYRIAIDASDNLYVTDFFNNNVRKITPAGVVSTYGNATFNRPLGIAVDANGYVYVSEYSGNRIRKINPNGSGVSVLAGSLTGDLGNVDGNTTAARFNKPAGLAVDAAGNVYVADEGNHRIRKITPSGVVSTFAGSTVGYANGTGTAAQFNGPAGITIDSDGTLYVTDRLGYRVRKVTSSKEVSLLAGSGASGNTNGEAATASFRIPAGIAIDASGNFYIADRANHLIRKITIE